MKLEASKGRLSTIDFVFAVVDTPTRPLDFTLLLNLKSAPDLEALRAGAISARNLFPTTGSYIHKNQWRRFAEPLDGVEFCLVPSGADLTRMVEEFLDSPFDLLRQTPVQQLVLKCDLGEEVKLVTRFHHVAADGLSAALWLGHQLRVAYGEEAPVKEAKPFQDLVLQNHPSPAKKSQFAFGGPPKRLRTSGQQRSGKRRWNTISFPATDLRRRCPRVGGFTYSDLLATCALETFLLWNGEHSDATKQGVGLWLPVNIRRNSFVGFGNGTSRIRLYASYPQTASLIEKCREIRRQVSWSMEHGEWAVPKKTIFDRLPATASAPLLRSYLNRPGVDIATGVFSHVDRWPALDNKTMQNLDQVESVGQLHMRHCLAINGVSHRGQTWLTFTYDPGLLSSDDVHRLQVMYEDQVTRARRELA
jgi:hypothetical protein